MQVESQYLIGLLALFLALVVANVVLWWILHHTSSCTHKHTTPFVWHNKTLHKCERCGAIIEDNSADKA